jgi:DNA-binding response OmpR family regulator
VTDDGAVRPAELVCVPAVDGALADGARRAGLRACPEPDAKTAATAVVERRGEVAAVVVDATGRGVLDAMATCKVLRRLEGGFEPIVVVVTPAQLTELALRDELYDDFVLAPVDAEELAARLRHLAALRRSTLGAKVVAHGELTINLETYQAAVAGRALDLTYMEYELLRFFAANPGRVLTRETLLSRVWGYEYYGGARTVDVHVRRLRAKLGEEHAHLIHTVRSVGYRFG